MGTTTAERTAVERMTTTMKALVRDSYGPPAKILQLEEVEKPAPEDDDVVVRVRAASLNRIDWYEISGTPDFIRALMGLRRPKERVLGSDFAGTVQAVGKDVTDLKPGDEVFGARGGALAEFVSVRTGVAKKPASLTFEEAAAVPVAAPTALQGLRSRNVEQSRALGADRVIDYTREDFTRTGERFDVFFDNAGSRRWSQCKRVLTCDSARW
jgi:NADPH:quinone reductase-like Zn-dependent oxidoreductase